MPLTKESARQLARLSEQDKVLDALQLELDKIPKAIAEIQTRIEARKVRLTEIRGRANQVGLQKKDGESKMAAKEGEIKKHSQELNLVKTNDAFRALQTEIDKGKVEVGDLETEILTFMDQLDQLAKEEKAAAAEIKAEESEDLAEIQAFQKDKAALDAKFAAETQKRDGLKAGIEEDVLKHYDHLRKRKPGSPALSPILKNMCGACRMTLPPQFVVEVVKAKAIQTCESCHRILYLPEAAGAVAPAPAEAKPAS